MSNELVKKFKTRERELLKYISELEAKVKELESKANNEVEANDIPTLVSLIEESDKTSNDAKDKLRKLLDVTKDELLNDNKLITYINDIDLTIYEAQDKADRIKEFKDLVESINSRLEYFPYCPPYAMIRLERDINNFIEDKKAKKRIIEEAKYFVPRKANQIYVDNPNTYTSVIDAFKNITPKGIVSVYNADMEKIGTIDNYNLISRDNYFAEAVLYVRLGVKINSDLYNMIKNSRDFKKLVMEASMSKSDYIEFQYSKLLKNLDVKGEVYPFDIGSMDKETAISKINELNK